MATLLKEEFSELQLDFYFKGISPIRADIDSGGGHGLIVGCEHDLIVSIRAAIFKWCAARIFQIRNT